jgi:hypothetical protein
VVIGNPAAHTESELKYGALSPRGPVGAESRNRTRVPPVTIFHPPTRDGRVIVRRQSAGSGVEASVAQHPVSIVKYIHNFGHVQCARCGHAPRTMYGVDGTTYCPAHVPGGAAERVGATRSLYMSRREGRPLPLELAA